MRSLLSAEVTSYIICELPNIKMHLKYPILYELLNIKIHLNLRIGHFKSVQHSYALSGIFLNTYTHTEEYAVADLQFITQAWFIHTHMIL